MALLQTLQNWCPSPVLSCLRPLLLGINRYLHNKHKQEGSIHHLEEQEFQFRPSMNQQEGGQTQLHNQPLNEQKLSTHEQSIDVKINLEQPNQQQELINHQSHAEGVRKYNFKLNLEPFDQYYDLIDEKTRDIKQYFQQQSSLVLTRKQRSMVTIKQIQTITGFKMIINLRLPCSYSFYLQTINNEELIQQISTVIAKSRIVEAVHPNLTLNILQFKKFMLLEPRYFSYLKYQNSNGGQHWQIAMSTKDRMHTQISDKECQLFSVSCFEEQGKGLAVNVYLQADLKSNIRAKKVVHRGCEEVANYWDAFWNYASANYSQISA